MYQVFHDWRNILKNYITFRSHLESITSYASSMINNLFIIIYTLVYVMFYLEQYSLKVTTVTTPKLQMISPTLFFSSANENFIKFKRVHREEHRSTMCFARYSTKEIQHNNIIHPTESWMRHMHLGARLNSQLSNPINGSRIWPT